jgi:glycine cleavage system H protein
MIDSDEQKLFHVIPPEESKCVWMTAGILSYQLCDREFECERCPLDIALRQRFTQHQPKVNRVRPAASPKEPEESRVGVLFGRKHLWMKRRGENKVRLGIEPGMASVLVSPMAIVLPALGAQIARNKACSWIVLGGGTLPMVSPITGQVTATNNMLAEHPHAVCASPLDEGWLFELSVSPADVDDADVLATADVARIYADDERALTHLLSTDPGNAQSEHYQSQTEHGRAIERLSERLGPTEYLKLLRNIYT